MTTERAGTVGAHWETELRRYEVVVPEDDGSPFGWDDPPTPNRAARRQARKRIAATTDPDRP